MRPRTNKGVVAGCLIRAISLAGLIASTQTSASGNPPVTTSKISLPSGPGSIEGLGESFEPQLNTGTYVFRIPLKMTALRGAVQPDLGLSYNSGAGNGPLGMGWSLSTPALQRQTDKGLPSYTGADTMVDSTGEELVRLADGTYRAENEAGFVRWEDLGADGWRATLKNGTVLRYGRTSQARQNHPTLGTFRWLLESAEDLNGNRVQYTYLTDRGQVYLSEIEWGLHATQRSKTLRLQVTYEDGRPDPIVDYRGRFRCETRKRLSDLTMWQADRRIRHWRLSYHPGYHLSLLRSFTVFGDNRSTTGDNAKQNIDFLPSLELDYSRQQLGSDWRTESVGPLVNKSLARSEADLVDLNRDALPDFLFHDSGNYFSMLNQGPGKAFADKNPFQSQVFLPPLDEPGVRISDWRGDGRMKLLIPGEGSFSYRDITSAVTVGDEKRYLDEDIFPIAESAVQMIDLNNDRATDLLTTDVGRFSFVLSSPSGGAAVFREGSATDLAADGMFANGWQFADMNGDRIADLVKIDTSDAGGCFYHAHMGYAEFEKDPVAMAGGPTDAELLSRGAAGLALVDIDMDGLSDLVQVDGNVVRIWPNRSGTAWGAPVEIVDPQRIPDWNDGATAVRFADMNGNGSVDVVWNDPDNGYFLKYLELHPRTKPNQLVFMSNGIGKTLEIHYTSSVAMMLADRAAGKPWTSVPPFPMPVVSDFTERDGMGGNYRTEITYRNGYYDPVEREFRGFETAVRSEVGNPAQGAPTLVTEYLFDTGANVEALKGRPLQVERRDADGKVFDRVSSEWTARQLPLSLAAKEPRRVTYCFQRRESSDVLEKGDGDPVRLLKEMEWDDYGNQTLLAEFGRVEGDNRLAWNDERLTRRRFTSGFTSGRQRWILDLPVQETVSDASGKPKAVTEYYYDDPTFGGANRGEVTKGNLTLVRQATDASEGDFIMAERLVYDAFGNVIRSLDPLAGSAPGHSRVFSYDDEFHTYPESETVELGASSAVSSLKATASYDPALGVMSSTTDFNGNRTRFLHDTFGRLAAIVKPGDTTAKPTETYDYQLGMPLDGGRVINWISAAKRETAGGGSVDSRMFFDGFGRKLMTRSEGENPGQVVVTDTVVFNDRRSEWKTYLPYFDTGGLAWRNPSFKSGFVTHTYDSLGRSIRALNPPEVAGGPRKHSRTQYQPLRTLLFDEEDSDPGSPHSGTPFIHYKDGLDRLVRVDELVSGQTWPTRYAYDVLDNLLRITDSQGNVKTMSYDGLKRMTGMDDPDRGLMSYRYDAASNLVETIDAKRQRILMTYDGANRILTEDYLDSRNLAPDVRYDYDSATAVPSGDGRTVKGGNCAGKLSRVRDLSGEEHLSYDSRGREAWRVKRVPDPLTGVLTSYQTAFSYDSLDRLTRITYPDGDHVGYLYTSRGLTEGITGGPGGSIVRGMDYIATGQLDGCEYGNGVTTRYDYDPRQRLKSLNTGHPSQDSPLISFEYEFDGASNIRKITDKRPPSAVPADHPRRNTQVFAYDDLYRIVRATYPDTAGEIRYSYDRIGNMLSQTSNIKAKENGLPVVDLGTMAYGGTAGASNRAGRGGQPGPHALSSIRNPQSTIRNFPYDANGNMLEIDGLACTWDFKDRLVAVENDKMRAEYTYDFTDRRIIKKVTSKSSSSTIQDPQSTLYIDRNFEIREDGAPVKYVWNGETRVARVIANLNAKQRIQRFRLQPGWNICTLAVSLSNAGRQLSAAPVRDVLRYDPAAGSYHAVKPAEALPAGTLLRIRASKAGELAVRGTPGKAAAVNYPAGGHWVGNPTFQPLSLEAAVPAKAPLWFFESKRDSWQNRLQGPVAKASAAPVRLEPGEAVFTSHSAPFAITPADPLLEVRYYHQDHLGSSSVMTDANGRLVGETAFYPFGHPRNEHEPRGIKEAYGFTQKERDGESGLNYFEARHQSSTLARFTSWDPAAGSFSQERLSKPSKHNPYQYCANNPVVMIDPDGRDEKFKESLQGAFEKGTAGKIFAVTLATIDDLATGAKNLARVLNFASKDFNPKNSLSGPSADHQRLKGVAQKAENVAEKLETVKKVGDVANSAIQIADPKTTPQEKVFKSLETGSKILPGPLAPVVTPFIDAAVEAGRQGVINIERGNSRITESAERYLREDPTYVPDPVTPIPMTPNR